MWNLLKNKGQNNSFIYRNKKTDTKRLTQLTYLNE